MTDRKKKYEDKRVTKRVSFNIDTNQDQKRLEFIKTIDFSNFVKLKIENCELYISQYLSMVYYKFRMMSSSIFSSFSQQNFEASD